jgi:perosamine synthetase
MRYIPYGRQSLDEDDIRAVTEVLRSDWLTTGPMVQNFQDAFAKQVGARHAVAVSSGTAGLHAAVFALGIKPGDEVIVPSMTFAATANCVVYQGGTPVFCDVLPQNLLLDPDEVERKFSARTKAIICVDYAGHPCDYTRLREIAARRGVALIADACHSLGATYNQMPVGTLADMTVFSFHPVKHITTGEGGMVTTDNPDLARRLELFRNHGITSDHRQRASSGSWFYEMVDLGFNYRITDFQCALGASQLKKLPAWVKRRQAIAAVYDQAFRSDGLATPLDRDGNVSHAYHLYVVQVTPDGARNALFAALRNNGIGANVHYIPVHLHPYYQKTFGTGAGLCPVAEKAYEKIISLPMFPGLTDEDVERVVDAVRTSMAALQPAALCTSPRDF